MSNDTKIQTFAVKLPDTRGQFCFLADGDGDPPRSYDGNLARRFSSEREAERAIEEAKKTHPLRERRYLVVPHPRDCR